MRIRADDRKNIRESDCASDNLRVFGVVISRIAGDKYSVASLDKAAISGQDVGHGGGRFSALLASGARYRGDPDSASRSSTGIGG